MDKIRVDERTALIVVDVQNDFCPGGALPVPEGDRVVPIINCYIDIFREAGAPIFFTRDWHPKDHISFKGYGGIWPPHCVQNTWGAAFHPALKVGEEDVVVSKGFERLKEAYSGFEGTDLDERLRRLCVERLLVGGLATDYCVKNTVLDGLKRGYRVFLLEDAVRGVDVKVGDSIRAVEEMVKSGAVKITLKDLL
ncbi:MAG: bifunctional nicotinamidase/pyrazinamidase [Nitrososphaerales archaeon]